MHTPQIVVNGDPALAKLAETTQQSYGLGFRILDYRGRRLLEHGGANDGFQCNLVAYNNWTAPLN